MSQNHGRGRTGDQFDEKIIIVRGALEIKSGIGWNFSPNYA
jgi:hypothetical protein